MNKHSVDTVTAALRDLDPAPPSALTSEEIERAGATLARILASPPQDAAPERSGRSRRRRGLALVGLAGAAGAAVPALLLGGGSAFASWTPEPEPLADPADAAGTCRAALEMPDRGEHVAIAERRGGWTYVLLTGPEAEGACLMPDSLIGHQDPVGHKKEGFFGTYDAEPAQAPTVAQDRVVETDSLQGSVPTPGTLPFTSEDAWFSWVKGYVGSDVTGVTVHPPVGPDVEASVAGGRFAAWWPSAQPSSRNVDVMGAWSYTVTLADGSTRELTGQ